MRCVTAYTEPHFAPSGEMVAYLNISERENGDVRVIQRGRDGACLELIIPRADWSRMIAEMIAGFGLTVSRNPGDMIRPEKSPS
jgi:hypothetical protein